MDCIFSLKFFLLQKCADLSAHFCFMDNFCVCKLFLFIMKGGITMGKSLFNNLFSRETDDFDVERTPTAHGDEVVVKYQGEVISEGKVSDDLTENEKVEEVIKQIYEDQIDRERKGDLTSFDKDHPNAMSSGETDSKGRPLPDTSKIREDSYQEPYSPLMSSLSKYL